jgi:hypothetical protein
MPVNRSQTPSSRCSRLHPAVRQLASSRLVRRLSAAATPASSAATKARLEATGRQRCAISPHVSETTIRVRRGNGSTSSRQWNGRENEDALGFLDPYRTLAGLVS